MTDVRVVRVAVLSGGPSGEHEVSLAGGRRVAAALGDVDHSGRDRESIARESAEFEPRYEVLPIVWGADGLLHGDGEAKSVDRTEFAVGLARLKSLGVHVVFPVLHGRGGEDGVVQAALDLAGIPYVGSGVRASAVAFDKRLSKAIFRALGIDTPAHAEVWKSEYRSDPIKGRERVLEQVGLPAIVKVSDSGSSLGVYRVETDADLARALDEGLQARPVCLVETFLTGRELTVGVVGNTHGESEDAPRALPVTEIVPRVGSLFDYRSKYTLGEAEEITPAPISEPVAAEVRAIAVSAHRAFECDGATRSDFILTDAGPQLLEINTIPGLTGRSLLPQGAAAAGVSFPALVHRLVELAVRRHPTFGPDSLTVECQSAVSTT